MFEFITFSILVCALLAGILPERSFRKSDQHKQS